MLLFSAQYPTLCFYLSHWRTAAQQRTPADPALVERNETEPEEPAGGEKVFLSVSPDDQLADHERRDLSMSISPALTYIAPIYLYLHTLLLCLERREKTILQKLVLVEACLQLFFFPFFALYGVCQTQWT